MPQTDPNQQNWGKYLGIGLEIAVGVALGYLIGAWVDRRWNSSPWGVLAGTMIGLAGGLDLLIRDAIRMNRD
jgi:F0F1-type ATP synthase assembly protein I